MKKKVELKNKKTPAKKPKVKPKVQIKFGKSVSPYKNTKLKKAEVNRIPNDVHLSIVVAIYDYVKSNPKMEIFWSDDNFFILAKSESLKVTKVVSHSVFQPYETTEDKKYCLMTIIQVGDFNFFPSIIESLLKLGCQKHRVVSVDSVPLLMHRLSSDGGFY